MSNFIRRSLLIVIALGWAAAAHADDVKPAAKSPADSAAKIVERFLHAWSDTIWEPKSPARRSGYMRPLDDAGWKARIRALQEIASLGSGATDELRTVLRDGSAPARMLAAQAAGLADCQALRDALIQAAEKDPDPAVRLYAVDSLGRLGKPIQTELYRRLLTTEKNRDVKMHLNYALERKDEPLEKDVRERLAKWDTAHVDAAKLGKPAPDFELPTLAGKSVKLSDYRGKRAVVLVFVYGDT